METNNHNFNNVDTRKRVITISEFSEYEHLQMMRKIYENYDENYMSVLADEVFDGQDYYLHLNYSGLSTYLHFNAEGRLFQYVDAMGNYFDGTEPNSTLITNMDELPF